MLLQTVQAGQVALGPSRREVLDGALLIGQEDEHVHARHLASGGGVLGQRLGAGSGCARPHQDPGTRGRRLQQVSARDAALIGARVAALVGVMHLSCLS
jgi:hypothetical protein